MDLCGVRLENNGVNSCASYQGSRDEISVQVGTVCQEYEVTARDGANIQ
jgi:hypothetical protein